MILFINIDVSNIPEELRKILEKAKKFVEEISKNALAWLCLFYDCVEAFEKRYSPKYRIRKLGQIIVSDSISTPIIRGVGGRGQITITDASQLLNIILGRGALNVSDNITYELQGGIASTGQLLVSDLSWALKVEIDPYDANLVNSLQYMVSENLSLSVNIYDGNINNSISYPSQEELALSVKIYDGNINNSVSYSSITGLSISIKTYDGNISNSINYASNENTVPLPVSGKGYLRISDSTTLSVSSS